MLAAVPLVIGMALALQIRPPLPPIPNSVTAPLPARTFDATLHLVMWALFVLLDLILWWSVLAYGSHRTHSPAERRLRRAAGWAAHPSASLDSPRRRLRLLPHPEPTMYLHTPTTKADAALAAGLSEEEHAPQGKKERREQQVEIRLLGPFELVGTRRPRRSATANLITYLVLHPAGASRDQLVEALYPGEHPQRAADRLWVVTPDARKVLGPAFDSDGGTYRLNRELLNIDVDHLDRLRASLGATTDRDEKRNLAEQALALYRGVPLASIGSAWADGERHRLNAIWLDLLEQAGRYRLDAGRPEDAIAAAERGILLDGGNERFVRLAMHAEAALGRRDAILARYERLRDELTNRYGLEPERETRLLYRQLLSQDQQSRDAVADQPLQREAAESGDDQEPDAYRTKESPAG